jgi:MutS domain V
MNDGAIPSLVPYLVPESAPVATKRFLRRLLLTPPPPPVSMALSTLISLLMSENGPAIPPLTVPPLGKILAMIRAGQAGAHVYGEILQTLHATILILDLFSSRSTDYNDHESQGTTDAMTSLMTLLEYESGMAASPTSLKRRCSEAIAAIEDILCPIYHLTGPMDDTENDERISDCSNLIPQSFLERNEAIWRGRVRKDAAPDAYDRVQVAAEQLSRAFENDFNEGCKNLIVQDIFNNLIALKDKPTTSRDDVKYIHPRDRFGKVLGNRYTTEAVQSALSDYVNACDKAAADVTKALVTLSHTLHDRGHLPAIVQASHTNLILSTAFYHAVKATSLGWSMAAAVEPDPEIDTAGHFHGVWPYWMERSEAVKNTFDLSGMWVLTAPNMSGKSTIMRSTAAAALLSVCGLCSPLQEGSQIRRFDHIFVRGASSDIPSEQKSAFGAEMADVAALLRCCTAKSLVFVDELGRGTSPRDGTRLSGAILEAMADAGMSGIFATHLHDILKLPLQSMNRITNKRMAIHERNYTNGEYTWTYRLEDGVCTDSLALITAKRFGVSNEILQRAEDLSAHLPEASFAHYPNEPTEGGSYPDKLVTPNISDIVEHTTGQRVIEIAPGWSPPAAYNGKSVVYALKLNTKPTRYYVGESDNIRKRIETHRAKNDGYYNAVVYIALAPLGKSQARMWEYKIIRKMASSGFLLDSVADGRSIRSMYS